MPVPGDDDEPTEPVSGAVSRDLEGGWKVRLDPLVWPVAPGDTIVRLSDGREWSVVGVPRLHQVPGVPDVDHVSVRAVAVPPEVDRGYPVPSA